jgi:hypothetical protein
VSRDIRSLGRMNDDRTDLEVFQQCRDLVFGDWTSAATFVPLPGFRPHIHAAQSSRRRSITSSSFHRMVILSYITSNKDPSGLPTEK